MLDIFRDSTTPHRKSNGPPLSLSYLIFPFLRKKVGKRDDDNERRHNLLFTAYLLTKDKFVNVMSKHGAGREETGVC